MGFTVVVHHGGAFVKKPFLRYEGGEVHAFHNLDIDNWSYFEALGLIQDLGYREYKSVKLWWKVGRGRMGKNLICICWDSHALEMGNYALEHKCEVDLYVEHTMVSEPVVSSGGTLLIANNGGGGEKPDSGRVGDNNNDEGGVMEDVDNVKGCCDDEVGGLNGVGVNNNIGEEVMEDVEDEKGCCDDEVDGNTSSDSIDDVHFSDSEEERNLGLDDGFEETHVQEKGQSGRKLRTKSTPVKNPILSPKKRAEKLSPKRLSIVPSYLQETSQFLPCSSGSEHI
ncbi:hypothetical protein SESBI_25611 [Sesbania bispinosa]|nr:hypothetical protein SESBI_25611 [Sesbania bispinosa]